MPRNLYSPRLSDDVVRSLYRVGKRLRIPMTRLADELIRFALEHHPEASKEDGPVPVPLSERKDAA